MTSFPGAALPVSAINSYLFLEIDNFLTGVFSKKKNQALDVHPGSFANLCGCCGCGWLGGWVGDQESNHFFTCIAVGDQ